MRRFESRIHTSGAAHYTSSSRGGILDMLDFGIQEWEVIAMNYRCWATATAA